ncbi:MAG: cytochrome-c oxidase, cbb3-type subunit III [Gammaproteobacteria bacterium]|nr:cytochrome-c oxidase, cbb3-type subunit III [Gammaproteobacteria bacterium]MDH5629009.1 cytochrome-c oxidase, cbb3-type subunit III [Gammaproteobacteria bacterium]
MNENVNEFWDWWIIVLVVINLVGCLALLYWTRKVKAEDENETTGHIYDGIEEYNNPLPHWWLNLFYITLAFSVVYLVLYPGMGTDYKGTLDWSQEKQHEQEVQTAKEKYQPLFDKYAAIPIEQLAQNKDAIGMGKRIFVNTCFGCHGSDGRGNPGYPDLTDNDWLWGGSAEEIKFSIVNGRTGVMPGFGPMLNADQLDGLVQYVGQLSGHKVDANAAETGKQVFDTQCFVCHGNDGKGNKMFGAPNLTDDIWLYSGSSTNIAKTIKEGRTGVMPAHGEILGDAKAHLVAAYVYSLSNQNESDQ